MDQANTEVPVGEAKSEAKREERVLTYGGFLLILSYTIEEALVQQATRGQGFTELLTSDRPRHTARRGEFISESMAAFQTLELESRGVQEAIELMKNGEPVSLIQHTENNWMLDLDKMGNDRKKHQILD